MKVDLIAILIPVAGIVLLILNLGAAIILPNSVRWRWVKLAYALIGLMWASMYALLLFGSSSSSESFSNSVFMTTGPASFIRPMILLTLGILLSSSIITIRRYWTSESFNKIRKFSFIGSKGESK